MRVAFCLLAAVGLVAVLLAVFTMPETRPAADDETRQPQAV